MTYLKVLVSELTSQDWLFIFPLLSLYGGPTVLPFAGAAKLATEVLPEMEAEGRVVPEMTLHREPPTAPVGVSDNGSAGAGNRQPCRIAGTVNPTIIGQPSPELRIPRPETVNPRGKGN